MSHPVSTEEYNRIHQLEVQLGLARREISNLRQQLKSLTFIHKKECSEVREMLENWQCQRCRSNQETENLEGAVGNPASMVTMTELGIISTEFPEKRGTPRQPVICANTVAKLILNNQVFTNPDHALEGLQEFSHMWILFYFHKNDSTHVRAKVSPPRLNGARTGIFATRSPHRPNPIGLSLVKIDRIMANTIYFNGVDMVDGTPVLDIKPYIPHYDNPVMINLLEPACTMESPDSLNNRVSRSEFDGNLEMRIMDGEETGVSDVMVRPIQSERSSHRLLVGELYTRIGEREAPDGEEESSISTQTPNQSHVPTSEGHIRVPSWIDDSPVSTLTVRFKERALFQISQLGTEGEEKKVAITNILREDPRSTYLRERWSGHCYVFRISELYVSCKFDDATHTVTVYQIFQNASSENND